MAEPIGSSSVRRTEQQPSEQAQRAEEAQATPATAATEASTFAASGENKDNFAKTVENKFVSQAHEQADNSRTIKQLEQAQQERLNDELAARIRQDLASRNC